MLSYGVVLLFTKLTKCMGFSIWGTRDGAVVRAVASHQCGPGSNPGIDAICGLSWLLVLSFAPRGFSPGTPVFPSPQKPTFPNSNSTRNLVDEEPVWMCYLQIVIYLFILFIYSDVGHVGFKADYTSKFSWTHC